MPGVIEVDALFTMPRRLVAKHLETRAYYPAARGNSQGRTTPGLKSDDVTNGE